MQVTQEEDLIIQIYFTTSFLIELRNNNFLESDCYKNMPFGDTYVKENLPKIGIDNQGALLMTLYSLLVIPKETLHDRFPNEFLDLNNKIEAMKTSSASTYSADEHSIDYIRHIRNAVAHGRVKFVNGSVTFEDERTLNKNKPNEKIEKFHTTLHLSVIGQFLTDLQDIFVLFIKSLQRKHVV
jgi:hypothetical protein